MLRATDLTMQTLPLSHLLILPHLLHQLCPLSSSMGSLGPSMKAYITFGLLDMLLQNNLAPSSTSHFDTTQQSCRRDVLVAPPGLLPIIRWSKTIDVVSRTPMLPIPEVKDYPSDPLVAYRELLATSPSTHPNKLLLSMGDAKA